MDTIKAVLAIATQNQWHVYQMYVKSSFLNGILEEEVYVDQQIGYTIKVMKMNYLRLKSPCVV